MTTKVKRSKSQGKYMTAAQQVIRSVKIILHSEGFYLFVFCSSEFGSSLQKRQGMKHVFSAGSTLNRRETKWKYDLQDTVGSTKTVVDSPRCHHNICSASVPSVDLAKRTKLSLPSVPAPYPSINNLNLCNPRHFSHVTTLPPPISHLLPPTAPSWGQLLAGPQQTSSYPWPPSLAS
jgi:hypothetical protein